MFWRAIHKQNSTGGISSNKTNPVYTKLAQAKYITLYYATFIILELPYMKPQNNNRFFIPQGVQQLQKQISTASWWALKRVQFKLGRKSLSLDLQNKRKHCWKRKLTLKPSLFKCLFSGEQTGMSGSSHRIDHKKLTLKFIFNTILTD